MSKKSKITKKQIAYMKIMHKLIDEREIEIDGEWVKAKDCKVIVDPELSKEMGMEVHKWVKK